MRKPGQPRRSVTAAWKLPADTPFVAIPLPLFDLIRVKKLSMASLGVIAIIIDRWRPTKRTTVRVSEREIAAVLPCSRARVRQIIAELVGAGLLVTSASRGSQREIDLAPLILAVSRLESGQRSAQLPFRVLSSRVPSSGSNRENELSTGFPQTPTGPPAIQSGPPTAQGGQLVASKAPTQTVSRLQTADGVGAGGAGLEGRPPHGKGRFLSAAEIAERKSQIQLAFGIPTPDAADPDYQAFLEQQRREPSTSNGSAPTPPTQP